MQRRAHRHDGVAQPPQALFDLLERPVAHQPGDRQRQLGRHLPLDRRRQSRRAGAIRRFTAAAMSASLQPMTQILWLSWPIDEAMAPRLMPKPLDEAVARLPWSLCAAQHRHLQDVALDVGHEGAVARRADRSTADRSRICPGRMPITGIAPGSLTGIWKVAAVTGLSFTRSSPTSGTSGRALKRSGVTGAPRQITECTLQVARSSSSTMSARWPAIRN